MAQSVNNNINGMTWLNLADYVFYFEEDPPDSPKLWQKMKDKRTLEAFSWSSLGWAEGIPCDVIIIVQIAVCKSPIQVVISSELIYFQRLTFSKERMVMKIIALILFAFLICLFPIDCLLASTPTKTIEEKYKPHIDPANFVGIIDNKYFPLKPGM